MATVHLGRLVADGGFSRLVAIKVLRSDRVGSSFEARALEAEARLVSRIRHPNVVSTLDVIADGQRPILVMDYVEGESLAKLLGAARERGVEAPVRVVGRIVADVLKGLHAAHEARDAEGAPLGIVHRDVSPQNVIVGVDGLARLVDFGIARAARRSASTLTGVVKGKLSYMAPEQERGLPLTRQADIYAAGKVLAEATHDPAIAPLVDLATRPDPRDRFASAAEMAAALEDAVACASSEEVARWVCDFAADELDLRAELARSVESAPRVEASNSIAFATPEVAPRSSHLRPRIMIACGLAASCIVTFVASRRQAPPLASQATERSEPASSVAAPEAALAVPTPPSDLAEPPEQVAPPEPRGSKRSPARTNATRLKSPSRPAPGDHCQPPFTLDENGMKHYRVECL